MDSSVFFMYIRYIEHYYSEQEKAQKRAEEEYKREQRSKENQEIMSSLTQGGV
jgi:hypothetical protein